MECGAPTTHTTAVDEAKPDSNQPGPVQTAAKRTKQTRVHKREKELFGLVTPIFLPLLEAGDRDSSPVKQRKEQRQPEKSAPPSSEQGSPLRDADVPKEDCRPTSPTRDEEMECSKGAVMTSKSAKEMPKPELEEKKKVNGLPLKKKSSLRQNNALRPKRKRVSLIIDDQIVLPAEEIIEPPLTSPSETTASSTSNSTASLDDRIDLQLIQPGLSVHHEKVQIHEHDHDHNHGAVHHSLPLPMSLPSTSPTKHTGHTISESPSGIDLAPQQKVSTPLAVQEPLPTATRTYPDPSPATTAAPNMPRYASATPIYADEPELADELQKDIIEEDDEQDIHADDSDTDDFSTYVGGMRGSGLDNVNQSSSYGYPSSLGASYLESYMKSRPLSVRLAAAEKGELVVDEKKKLVSGDKRERKDKEKKEKKRKKRDGELGVGVDANGAKGRVVDDVDDGVMGAMDGF
jgi:hypothetical protein